MDVLATISKQSGHQATDAMRRAGVIVGMASNHKVPKYLDDVTDLDFLDFPFTVDGATFEDHLDMTRRAQPRYAVAPDIEDDRDPDVVIDQADALLDHADVVIVVPKSVHPSFVPDRFRVGFTAQPKWGSSAPWTVFDYRDCPSIHVLGGSPRRHYPLADDYGLNVRSVDTTSPLKSANFGDIWNGQQWEERGDLDYYERIEASYRNIIDAWDQRLAATSASD